MMGFITTAISNYMQSRAAGDFRDDSSQLLPKIESGLKRWAAHILLTTSINIGTALPDQTPGRDFDVPADHFYNLELVVATLNRTRIWVREF